MSLQSRIDSLKQRHGALDAQTAAEEHRPKPDAEALARLKHDKLRLKDELERLGAQPPR